MSFWSRFPTPQFPLEHASLHCVTSWLLLHVCICHLVVSHWINNTGTSITFISRMFVLSQQSAKKQLCQNSKKIMEAIHKIWHAFWLFSSKCNLINCLVYFTSCTYWKWYKIVKFLIKTTLVRQCTDPILQAIQCIIQCTSVIKWNKCATTNIKIVSLHKLSSKEHNKDELNRQQNICIKIQIHFPYTNVWCLIRMITSV